MINIGEMYQMVFMMVVSVVMITTMFMTMMSYMIDWSHLYWRFAERWNGRLAMVGVLSLILIKCLS